MRIGRADVRAPASARARTAPHPGVEESAEITLDFDDNRLASLLFGHYDQNLAHVERRLGVVANANGNRSTGGMVRARAGLAS